MDNWSTAWKIANAAARQDSEVVWTPRMRELFNALVTYDERELRDTVRRQRRVICALVALVAVIPILSHSRRQSW